MKLFYPAGTKGIQTNLDFLTASVMRQVLNIDMLYGKTFLIYQSHNVSNFQFQIVSNFQSQIVSNFQPQIVSAML